MDNPSHDFTYLLRVRYSECDAQKVVFNAKYAEYVDIASTEFLRSTIGSYEDIHATGLDFQAVNLTIDWIASAHCDDIIVIASRTSKIGTTSFRLEFDFYNQTTKKAIVVAKASYVLLNAETMTKTPIPSEMRKMLLAGAPGQVVNHSGAALIHY